MPYPLTLTVETKDLIDRLGLTYLKGLSSKNLVGQKWFQSMGLPLPYYCYMFKKKFPFVIMYNVLSFHRFKKILFLFNPRY